MMKKLVAAITLFLFLSPAFAQSPNDLFQQALVMERSEGNLQEAISLYERVVATGSDRSLAAKALIRIGENYERQGLRQARQAYQRVLDDYSEQRDTARIARDRLASLLAAMADKEPQRISSIVVKKHVMDIPDNSGHVSPDGRFLSFVEWTSGNMGILNLETGEEKLASSDGNWGQVSAFADRSIWSPDGKKLMYSWVWVRKGIEIRIYNTETGNMRVLVSSDSSEIPFPIKWFGNGKHFLAINEPRTGTDAITFVNAETANTRVVKQFSDNWHTFGEDLSPDEKHIVYELYEPGALNDGSAPVSLKILATDGSYELTLVDNGFRNFLRPGIQKANTSCI
ncbi:MAG: tetratricopeptide repeat protein [Bacteroidetes bacterium]|nr:tetratricopeptide repeat protein [Bacteroidota bacterium]